MSLLIPHWYADTDNPKLVGANWVREDGPATLLQKKILEVNGVQNPTVAWARRNGIRATKLQGTGNRSQPDYMFRFQGGHLFLIEFKRAGEWPTALQTETIHDWLMDGFKVEVHDTKESAICALNDFKNLLAEAV